MHGARTHPVPCEPARLSTSAPGLAPGSWYIQEHVQSTAVAIETQGFTFCTSGKKRDTLKGQATMQIFPHLKNDLEEFAPSIYNGLQTEVSTSKERCFPLITFIDTPGLVDGSFQYLFPVEDAILAVAKHTDLIYIFFDPIGQALCDRTMKVIERLNHDHAEKLRYFLSKADTVPNERDRQKVVVQITQNLSSRVRNAHAFELPSLYIPDHSSAACKIENILEATCSEMQQTINQNVQNNLNKLERDCKRVYTQIEELLSDDAAKRARNRKATCQGLLAFVVSLLGPLLLLGFFVHRAGLMHAFFVDRAVGGGADAPSALLPEFVAAFGQTCDALVAPEAGAQRLAIPTDAAPPAAEGGGESASASGAGSTTGLMTLPQFLIGTLGFFLSMQLVSKLLWRHESQFTKREVSNLTATQKFVKCELLELKGKLYRLYIDQLQSEIQ